MAWIYTDSERLTGRWTTDDFAGYELTVTISCIEWFNTDTGATYCLVSDGLWETGGRFRLLFKAPRSEQAIDATVLLGPIWLYYEPATTARNYRKVRERVVNFMGNMLPATNVFDLSETEELDD